MTKLASHVNTFGLILFTDRFEACVEFYRDIIGLPLWFQKGDGLVCFRYGDGYLMVERGGSAAKNGKSKQQNPVTLRFNVNDVDRETGRLISLGAVVKKESFDWGDIATFWDPDGNECQLKNSDDISFL